jgi:hypothetical protein
LVAHIHCHVAKVVTKYRPPLFLLLHDFEFFFNFFLVLLSFISLVILYASASIAMCSTSAAEEAGFELEQLPIPIEEVCVSVCVS